jgi:hypothetical protein
MVVVVVAAEMCFIATIFKHTHKQHALSLFSISFGNDVCRTFRSRGNEDRKQSKRRAGSVSMKASLFVVVQNDSKEWDMSLFLSWKLEVGRRSELCN